MPSLVDKMRIAGNRVNFALDGLELVIQIREIFQFRRAYKGKIRGIKEKHRPLVKNIRLGYDSERFILISMYGKITHFFLNQ
jgi:hypothetical protein